MTRVHVVILAGGTAARMGGVSKPDVIARGRRLLDHVLESLPDDMAGRVVVAPEGVDVPEGVIRTLEDPPLGGPAAGIRAGVLALVAAGLIDCDGADDLIAVVPTDAPLIGRAIPLLVDALGEGRAVTGGHALPLVARAGALLARLEQVGDARDMSIRRLTKPLSPNVAELPLTWVDDLDTDDDVRNFDQNDGIR